MLYPVSQPPLDHWNGFGKNWVIALLRECSMNYILNLSTDLAPELKISIRKKATTILQDQGYSLTSAPLATLVSALESVASEIDISFDKIMVSGISSFS